MRFRTKGADRKLWSNFKPSLSGEYSYICCTGMEIFKAALLGELDIYSGRSRFCSQCSWRNQIRRNISPPSFYQSFPSPVPRRQRICTGCVFTCRSFGAAGLEKADVFFFLSFVIDNDIERRATRSAGVTCPASICNDMQ